MARILVVDDEIGALTLIGIMLERGGFEVLKAKDAQQALEVLDARSRRIVERRCRRICLGAVLPGRHLAGCPSHRTIGP